MRRRARRRRCLHRWARCSTATAPPAGPRSQEPGSRAGRLSAPPASAARLLPPPSCPDDMVQIPAGQFFQGSDAKDALANEKPAHNVTLDSYCIDLYEVTAARVQGLLRRRQVQARRHRGRLAEDHARRQEDLLAALQHRRSGQDRSPDQLRQLGHGQHLLQGARTSACPPRPSGSTRRAAPTAASTRGATKSRRAQHLNACGTRVRRLGQAERAPSSCRCTRRTTASPPPRRSESSRRADRASVPTTSSATSGSGSPTGTATTRPVTRRIPPGRQRANARDPRRRLERQLRDLAAPVASAYAQDPGRAEPRHRLPLRPVARQPKIRAF